MDIHIRRAKDDMTRFGPAKRARWPSEPNARRPGQSIEYDLCNDYIHKSQALPTSENGAQNTGCG